ncbi:MAG: hypothetical protein R3222_00895 [Balneolaceae bacterium]|nr:hypothetical protein [Balneolaceae bacterium]
MAPTRPGYLEGLGSSSDKLRYNTNWDLSGWSPPLNRLRSQLDDRRFRAQHLRRYHHRGPCGADLRKRRRVGQ